MSFIRHRRATSPNKFECRNVYSTNRIDVFIIRKDIEKEFKEVIGDRIVSICSSHNVTVGYDGVAYYSKRVNDEIFALCAINLALFVDYEGEYSKIVEHMKMDDAFNFGLYKQLCASLAASLCLQKR